jgi:hypothetical protein
MMAWIPDHLDEDLSAPALARRAWMAIATSPAPSGVSPVEYRTRFRRQAA